MFILFFFQVTGLASGCSRHFHYLGRNVGSGLRCERSLGGTLPKRSVTRSEAKFSNELKELKKMRGKEQKTTPGLNWRNFFISVGILSVFFAAGLYYKKVKEMEREKQRRKSLGKASIGGSFELGNFLNGVHYFVLFTSQWAFWMRSHVKIRLVSLRDVIRNNFI